MKKIAMTIMALVLVAGCSSVSTNEIRHAPDYEPTTAQDVTVYEDATNMPCRAHDRLAVIKVEDKTMLTSEEELYTKLKHEAAKFGANAVIVTYLGTYGGGSLGLNSDSSAEGAAVRMTCDSSAEEGSDS